MDTITQALLGAAIGQAGFARKLGPRAVVIGALAGTVPDFDVIAGIAGETAGWVHHRGITHSLVATPIIGMILGEITWRMHHRTARRTGLAEHLRRGDASARAKWMWLWILGLATHPVLDFFTPYGTQLLAPLSDHRFALDAMAIIDPVYSAPLLLAILFGWMFGMRRRRSAHFAGAMLFASTAYLFFALGENDKALALAKDDLAAKNMNAAQLRAYPTLFQPFYRRVVARDGDHAHVAYMSTLNPQPLTWETKKAAPLKLTGEVDQAEIVQIFKWFARGDVLWQAVKAPEGGTRLYLADMRYGSPGTAEAPEGFWGLTARVDANGKVIEPLSRYSARPEPDKETFTQLVDATLGR
ncbi:MAG: metal-dependent hydrolase [Alphaproteobacteria bacterium]